MEETYEFKIVVTCQAAFDPDHKGKIPEKKIRESVVEAVKNAVSLSEDNGFSHRLADVVSIGVVDVE